MPEREAKFIIERQDDGEIVIADVGDHALVPTITNDAEGVVRRLHASGDLGQRHLLYHDSEGMLDELEHDGAGTFLGFLPGPPVDRQAIADHYGVSVEEMEAARPNVDMKKMEQFGDLVDGVLEFHAKASKQEISDAWRLAGRVLDDVDATDLKRDSPEETEFIQRRYREILQEEQDKGAMDEASELHKWSEIHKWLTGEMGFTWRPDARLYLREDINMFVPSAIAYMDPDQAKKEVTERVAERVRLLESKGGPDA